MAKSRLNVDDDVLLDQDLLEPVIDSRKRYYAARCKLAHLLFLQKYNQEELKKELSSSILLLGNDYYEALLKSAQRVLDAADSEYHLAEESNHAKLASLADVLECCEAGIRKPFNEDNFKRVTELANSVDTQASLGKKIGAGFLLFAGILTILSFGALVLATHGLALSTLPVIGPIVTTGLAWMAAAASTLGISANILTFVGLGAGVATSIGGTALALDGQAKGLAGSMHCFHNRLHQVREKEDVAETLESERAALLSV